MLNVFCIEESRSANPMTIRLVVFGHQTAVWRCVKALKAKALSVRSTSSSGEGEGPPQRAKGPLCPGWSSFNCFCIYAGFRLQDWSIM